MKNKLYGIILPILVIIVALGVAFFFVSNRSQPKKKSTSINKYPIVKVITLKKEDIAVQISRQGVVKTSKEIAIAPEASGQVVWINEDFQNGGKVNKGEIIFKLDKEEFELKKSQARAALAKAQYEKELIVAQKQAAEKGRKLVSELNKDSEEDSNFSSLALYEPQIKNAEASLASARAGLQQAQLNLRRTEIAAPFSGVFSSVSLSEGQLLAPRQIVGKLFSLDSLGVTISVPLQEVSWINFNNSKDSNYVAKVYKDVGSTLHSWQAKVKNVVPVVEGNSQQIPIEFAILSPLSNENLLLPIGVMVDVVLQGPILKDVVRVPSSIVIEDKAIWYVDKENKLQKGELQVLSRDGDYVIGNSNLQGGSLVLTSIPQGAVLGMKVDIFGEQKTEKLPDSGKEKL